MTLAIQTQNQTITAWDVIPRLARYQMLPQLIAESIIDQAIASIECTDKEKAIACQHFYQQHQLITETQRHIWGVRHGMNQEDIEELATRKLKIEKFKQATWGDALNIHFYHRISELDKVVFSIIRTKDIEIAQEIYFRIQEQEQSFAQLAKEYSQGREAEMGGKIGPVEYGTLPQPLVQLLRAHKPGTLLSPFPMGDEIVIIRIEEYIRAKLDESTRQRLLNERFKEWLQGQLKEQEYQVSILNNN